jgi:putative ABC transport system permease protein
MFVLRWLRGLIRRRGSRLAGLAVCVALAVALFASLGAFFSQSQALMTDRAIAGVPVDWQVELAAGTDPAAARDTIAADTGAKTAMLVGYADVAAFSATTGSSVQTTGTGKALGLPDGYADALPGEVRYLVGERSGVLLAQQTAANLQVQPGDTIRVERPGLDPVELRVDGVVDLPAADSLFQVVGAPAGAGATAPPDNVVILPLSQWHTLFDPEGAKVPGSTSMQVHLKLPQNLPPAPTRAYTEVIQRARHLEAQMTGTVRVGNNLGAILDSARADAVYSELLFLFLGIPGVVLAFLLAAVVGAAGRERRRREQALLRLRGASHRAVIGAAAVEALFVGIIGAAIGLAGAYGAQRVAFAGAGGGGGGLGVFGSPGWLTVSVLVGLALAGATVVVPAWRDARLLTVRASIAALGRRARPLWQRLYVDILLLIASGVIYWQSVRDAYKVVLVPEGVPTISVNYLTLLAPITLWLGAALLAWRLSDLMLSRGRRVLARIARPFAGNLSGVAASSMSRQRGLLSRGLVIVALTVSFALSVALFNTTYMGQARVDAQLTNGADVTVAAGSSGLPSGLAAKVAGLHGVVAAVPMQHRLAYVGSDLQDLYGIDPATIERATPMSDAFFKSGSAAAVLADLVATPDGVLVSDETVQDYQLQPGDLVKLRLQSASDRAYHAVPFRFVGVAREFPTAPHDSFLVANAAYVARMTGADRFETLLVRVRTDPVTVAGEVRGLLAGISGAKVTDINTELKTTLTSLTAIDLTGLTRLELIFAAIMAVAASGLLLLLGFSERRRTFAIARALGASRRQLGWFLWTEAAFVNLGGLALGAISGWLLSLMIVRILTGVFDPPPQHLSVPGGYVALFVLAVVVSVTTAGWVAITLAWRPSLKIIRDL